MKTMRKLGEGRTDKVDHHRYDRFYPLFLERFRKGPMNMLEIGYDRGGSAAMWAEYFPQGQIYCADLKFDKAPANHRIHPVKCDQSVSSDLQGLIRTLPKMDFIIDDGSHVPSHQRETFRLLFPWLLKPGGVYIIEDVETTYWRADAEIYGYSIGDTDQIPDLVHILSQGVNQQFNGVINGYGAETVTLAYNCVIVTKSLDEDLPLYQRPYRLADRLP